MEDGIDTNKRHLKLDLGVRFLEAPLSHLNLSFRNATNRLSRLTTLLPDQGRLELWGQFNASELR